MSAGYSAGVQAASQLKSGTILPSGYVTTGGSTNAKTPAQAYSDTLRSVISPSKTSNESNVSKVSTLVPSTNGKVSSPSPSKISSVKSSNAEPSSLFSQKAASVKASINSLSEDEKKRFTESVQADQSIRSDYAALQAASTPEEKAAINERIASKLETSVAKAKGAAADANLETNVDLKKVDTPDEADAQKEKALKEAMDAEKQDALDRQNALMQVNDANRNRITNFLGLRADGSIDENSNGYLATKKKEMAQFKTDKEALLKSQEGQRLLQVAGQARAQLAARGVSAADLTDEQIIALAGDAGAKAFIDIAQLRDKTLNDINENQQKAEAEIADAQNKGILSINDAATANALLQAETQKSITEIKKNFLNSIFSLGDENYKRNQQNAADVENTVSKVVTEDFSKDPEAYSILQGLKGATAVETMQNIQAQLADPNSALYKLYLRKYQSQQAAAAAVQAAEIRLKNAQASKALSSGSGSSGATVTSQMKQLASRLGIQGNQVTAEMLRGLDEANVKKAPLEITVNGNKITLSPDTVQQILKPDFVVGG